MPIKSMTVHHQPGAGLRRIGKIVKGAQRTDDDIAKKRPGKDLTHFRIHFDEGMDYLLPAWESLYGKEPRRIGNTYMLADDVDNAFGSWMEEWGAGGLIRRCDGETIVRWFNPSEGRCINEPIACLSNDGCGCKQIGRLNILLPEFIRATGVFGYFTLETHAVNDIRHIFNLLSDVRSLYGTIYGVPFVVERIEREFELPEMDKRTKAATGKRIHVKKWMVNMSVDQTYALQQMPAMVGSTAPALPHAINAGTGEITSPALPASVSVEPQWTPAEAQKWGVEAMKSFGLSEREILMALGVNRLGEWPYGVYSAREQVGAWLDAQLSEDVDPESQGLMQQYGDGAGT